MEYKVFKKCMQEKKTLVYAKTSQVITIYPLGNYITCIEINIRTKTNEKGYEQYFKATNTEVEMETYELIESLEEQGYSRVQ